MNPQTLFHDAASNIIYLVLFGTRFDYEDNTLKQFIHYFTESAKIANGTWGMVRYYNLKSSIDVFLPNYIHPLYTL